MEPTPEEPNVTRPVADPLQRDPVTGGEAHPPVRSRSRLMSPAELEHFMPALVEILCDTVNGGASLGFLPPLTREEALHYWLSLRPEVQAGSRLLLLACTEDRVVGSGQLAFSSLPSGRHR